MIQKFNSAYEIIPHKGIETKPELQDVDVNQHVLALISLNV